VVQYAAVRQILYVFYAHRLLVEERHQRIWGLFILRYINVLIIIIIIMADGEV